MPISSTPVEMNHLDAQSQSQPQDLLHPQTSDTPLPTDADPQEHGISSQPSLPPVTIATSSDVPSSYQTDNTGAAATMSPRDHITREYSTAIGPSSDQPVFKGADEGGPIMMITLLLISGARHPYRIDERYLKKRNVYSEDNNPFNLSVYTLKELIWREWREEWESRPSSPGSIRLIHFGRLLDDKAPLKECRFNADAPNVVHMTVRPQEVVDEEDAKTVKQGVGRDRDGNERSPGCRCVIL
ncbi:MAG: hypothetical protein M1817_005286 [Caeruleum heppii]|nr:MAG: hypothetical protein M1817_005286 [Caeruleum heppii]